MAKQSQDQMWKDHISLFQTILKSYSNQNRTVFTKKKKDAQVSPSIYSQLIYNEGVKTIQQEKYHDSFNPRKMCLSFESRFTFLTPLNAGVPSKGTHLCSSSRLSFIPRNQHNSASIHRLVIPNWLHQPEAPLELQLKFTPLINHVHLDVQQAAL